MPEKTIFIWYGEKVREVPISIIYRRLNLEDFNLKELTNTRCIQIYYDNVIRLHLDHGPYETSKSILIDNTNPKCISAFIELLNSDEDYFSFKNRFKAMIIDEDTGISIIVDKQEATNLPIKVYGFLKPMKLGNGRICFSYRCICDEVSPSQLSDLEEQLRKDLRKHVF